jgi:hypothetical protein
MAAIISMASQAVLRRFTSRHRYTLISAAGATIMALALVLSAVIFNVGPLRTLLPTPMAFRPASQNESLIIVADFDDRSGSKHKGIDPAQYIYEQLAAQANKISWTSALSDCGTWWTTTR